MKKLWLLGVLALSLYSCGGKKTVLINTVRPAEIDLGQDIQTLLVVDRTKPADRDRWINIGEGVLTGEGLMADRAAAQELVNSLKNALQTSPRFQVLIAKERLTGNSLTAVFPDPIAEATQINLLRRYQADAIVALEILDTDFIVTEGRRKVKRTVGEGDNRREVEVDEWYAEGVANIKIGMRLYDTQNRNLVDQELLSKTNTWEAAADSKAGALAALISRDEATLELCRRLGHQYAHKIAPMRISLRRSYYTKAKESQALEVGGRMAEVGDWQKAIDVWQEGLQKAREEKDQRRLALNIAVAYEVLGDLPQALAWSQKAYVQYGSKEARGYSHQLKNRMNDEERLAKQIPNGL